jgi:hypothetical protein
MHINKAALTPVFSQRSASRNTKVAQFMLNFLQISGCHVDMPMPSATPPQRPGLPALAVLLFALLHPLHSPAQDTLGRIENEGIERTGERQATQRRIDALDAQNRELLEDYRGELRIVQGLETYVAMLGQQIEGQNEEIDIITTSISDVAVIERQVLPLLSRMIDSLEQFIALDMPFLREERANRVEGLRSLLGRSDVTVAEKARRVFEAYQIETEFGRTIEAYKAKVALAGGEFDADFLRIGRIALMYRTVGDGRLGRWDAQAGQWRELPATPYRRLIEQGLRVARQEIAPELISIPLNPAQVASE